MPTYGNLLEFFEKLDKALLLLLLLLVLLLLLLLLLVRVLVLVLLLLILPLKIQVKITLGLWIRTKVVRIRSSNCGLRKNYEFLCFRTKK